MRKLLVVTLALIFAGINIMAQEHLSFMGIPINGSKTEFCKKLKAKGFAETTVKDVFSGNFTGQQTTVVLASYDGNNVDAVGVYFDESSEWNTLVSTYNYYKDLYILKYGEPFNCEEYNPSSRDSNFSRMHELGQGAVTYRSLWHTNGGFIELSIKKFSSLEGVVVISYMNSQNMQTQLQKVLEDI